MILPEEESLVESRCSSPVLMDLAVGLLPQFAVAFRPGVVGSLVPDVHLESLAEAMAAMEDVESAEHLCLTLNKMESVLEEHR